MDVLAVAVPFVWLGAVLAISFLEAPLKFRAPGITLALGLGIGRLVFRALNLAELVLAILLTVAVLLGAPPPTLVFVLLAAAWVVLLSQIGWLRPLLDRRARVILAGETPPRSNLHLAYVGLEVVKVILLPTLGAVLATLLSS